MAASHLEFGVASALTSPLLLYALNAAYAGELLFLIGRSTHQADSIFGSNLEVFSGEQQRVGSAERGDPFSQFVS